MLVSWDVKTYIKNIPTSFTDNYIRLLTDLDREFQYKSLSRIYNRIGNTEEKNKTADIIHAYLCIRMGNNDWSCSEIDELRRKYGSEVADALEWFRCTYFNHEMYKVYNAIKHGGEYPNAYLRLRDGLGLTPLHYAIILKNEDAIKYLLEQKDWKYTCPYGSSTIPFQMYEYVVSAAGNQLPTIEDILLKTHEETIELRNTINDIKIELKIRGVVNYIQDTNLFVHRMDYVNKKVHRASREDLKQLSANIDMIKENLRTAHENAVEREAMLIECGENLVSVMENAIDDALLLLEEVRKSNDPLANYLYRIYFEPDFFEQVLLAIKEKRALRLYHYKGLYFIAPEFAEINLPYKSRKKRIKVKTKNTNGIDKPIYGNSWFSNDAHHNLDTLKSEYRKLAKTYHPDVCDLSNSNQLFQSISAEYSEVCNSILHAQTTQWEQ